MDSLKTSAETYYIVASQNQGNIGMERKDLR